MQIHLFALLQNNGSGALGLAVEQTLMNCVTRDAIRAEHMGTHKLMLPS